MPSGHLPTFSAEMNLAADLTGYFQIGVSAIGVGKIGGAYGVGQFTVLGTRLQTFSTARGRHDELSGIAAGTVDCNFDDDNGDFDPDNAAGAYYPNIKLMRQVRIKATFSAVDYYLGYAFADGYTAEPLPLGANVSVSAADLFGRLDRKRISITFPAQTVGARLHALLDSIQWPPGQRTIDTSTLTVPAVTLTPNTSFLQHIDSLLKAEQGDFFIAGNGNVTFRARVRRLINTSRATFGAGGLPIKSISASLVDNGIFNDIHVKRTAGAEQIAADTASQNTYDVRSYVLDQVAADQLPSDLDANSWANWILGRHKDPVQRILTLDLDGTADDNLWPHVLGAEIGDRITVTHDIPGTKGVSAQDYYLESVQHHWSPLNAPEHVCTWGLSKATPLGKYMIIGSGQIGVSAVGY